MFAHPAIEGPRFAAIAEDLELRDAAPSDPDAFALLDPVRRLVELIGSGEGGGPRGEAFRAHARLVYHAFHHWRADKPTFAVDRATARALAASGPVGALPAGAGWLELPSTLFWAHLEPSATPEPVNGFFWAAPPGELQVLLVTGLRADRAGFGTLDARGAFGPDGFAESFAPRPGGAEPFANVLPGGDLDRLLSVITRGEALTLAARSLASVAGP